MITDVEIFKHMHGSNQLMLTFYAARETHDKQFRNTIIKKLDKLIAEQEPVYSLDQIIGNLKNQTGTPLEPFVINDSNTELAARFVQLAFSAGQNANHVKLVSEDALTLDGGLFLDKKLQGKYVQRFLEQSDSSETASWRLATNAGCSQSVQRLIKKLHVSANSNASDELGFTVNLICDDLASLGWLETRGRHDVVSLERSLSQQSWIGSTDRTLDRMGLQVKLSSHSPIQFCISARNAEALVRFTAALASNKTLLLSPGVYGEKGSAEVHITLDLAGDHTCDLDISVRRTGALPCEFMEADVNCVLDLDDTQIDQLFAMLRNSMTVSH